MEGHLELYSRAKRQALLVLFRLFRQKPCSTLLLPLLLLPLLQMLMLLLLKTSPPPTMKLFAAESLLETKICDGWLNSTRRH